MRHIDGNGGRFVTVLPQTGARTSGSATGPRPASPGRPRRSACPGARAGEPDQARSAFPACCPRPRATGVIWARGGAKAAPRRRRPAGAHRRLGRGRGRQARRPQMPAARPRRRRPSRRDSAGRRGRCPPDHRHHRRNRAGDPPPGAPPPAPTPAGARPAAPGRQTRRAKAGQRPAARGNPPRRVRRPAPAAVAEPVGPCGSRSGAVGVSLPSARGGPW
jgi:hypothetical protein